ncbi:serpin family protein [Streptomyces sp. NPDC029216]|uniref:serpin family protein n=1 Tax=Streptomyces sp. NPDC029216 TaxID=3154701 RepID=UPI0033D44884
MPAPAWTRSSVDETVEAVNALTARWAAEAMGGAGCPAGGTVFSAAGVWPLLAFLADAASGPARAELADAVGIPAEQAAGRAREFLTALGGLRGVDAALGLWTRRQLKVREEWAARLPPHTHRKLTGWRAVDRRALDAWAAEHSNGRITRMPADLSGDTQLLLASALALATRWIRPFTAECAVPYSGPWDGRRLAGLSRTTSLLDRVGVADTSAGHVTGLRVVGDRGIDVHLLLGEPDVPAGRVLAAGVDVLAGRRTLIPGDRLPPGEAGPGLTVEAVRNFYPVRPKLHVRTVAFDVAADHDLTAHADVFGLGSATGRSAGHFPGMTDKEVAVARARQSATAAFTDRGFEAAVVTAFEMGEGSARMPEPTYVNTEVHASFHRPFGFLAVHRVSRLVLAAGWVTDPQPYREAAAWQAQRNGEDFPQVRKRK